MNGFAKKVLNFRIQHGMSQKKLAEVCSVYGVPTGTKFTDKDISVYERGLQMPLTKKAAVICKVIGMRTSTLNKYRGVQIHTTPKYKDVTTTKRNVGDIHITINQGK